MTSGDDDARTVSEEIWLRYGAYIRKLCAYKLRSVPDAVDDCVQDVFVALFAAVSSGAVIREPKAWLTVTASHKIDDIFRALARENKYTVSAAPEDIEAVPASEDPPGYDLPQARILAAKDAFLASISPQDSELFELRFVRELKISEIAALTGKSESGVRQRIFRLKCKAKKFAREWAQDV